MKKKMKNNNGLVGVDMVIAVIAIILFSTLIVSLMYNNVIENVKLKKETLAMIYITEIFENVGIASYENIILGDYNDIGNNEYDENIEALIPSYVTDNNYYTVDMIITNVTDNEEILKKIQLTLTYTVQDKLYTCSMERMKIKE